MYVIDQNSETQVLLRSVWRTSTRNTSPWGCSRDRENNFEMLAEIKVTKNGIRLKSRVKWKKTRMKAPMLFLETTKTQIDELLRTKEVQNSLNKTCVSDFWFSSPKYFFTVAHIKIIFICGLKGGGSQFRGKYTQSANSEDKKLKIPVKTRVEVYSYYGITELKKFFF